MAILGVPYFDENPTFTINDLKFWCPKLKGVLETDYGQTLFQNLYPIANGKIMSSIFGVDWKKAMSLCIAHYAYLLGKQMQNTAGQTLDSFVTASAPGGVISSASVGQFSKSFDLDRSFADSKDSIWWNSTPYGQELYNLAISKPVLSMIVVTSNPVPGSGNLY